MKDSSTKDGLTYNCKMCLCDVASVVQVPKKKNDWQGVPAPAQTFVPQQNYRPPQQWVRNEGSGHIRSKGAFA